VPSLPTTVLLLPMYVRGFSTLGCGELSLDEALALAQRNELTQLELRALGGALDLPAYFAAKFISPDALAARFAESGISVVALDTSFRLLEGTASDRAELLKFLPWAEALGVRWLRIFDGGKDFEDAALARAAETLRWWQSLRREQGHRVELMIETHDLLFDAAKILRFVAAMPDESVHLLWDSHHTWKKGGEDPLLTWRAIKSRVVHVHVKDSRSIPSARHPYSYVLPGTGEFPMAPLRTTLGAEFSGVVSLEWERFWNPELPPLEAALRSAAEHRWW
jgi:sugar phosphate isomerase/epimerase